MDVLVAEAPDLFGYFVGERNFEEAREDLIDAIELWVMSVLVNGDEIRVINSFQLAR